MTTSIELINTNTFVVFYGLLFQGLVTPEKYIQYITSLLEKCKDDKKKKYLQQMIVDQLYIFIKVFLPFCNNLSDKIKTFTLNNMSSEEQCRILPLVDKYANVLTSVHCSYDVIIYENGFYSLILNEGKLKTIQHTYNITRLIEFKQIQPQLLADYFYYQYYQIQKQIDINNFNKQKPEQISKQYQQIFNHFTQYFMSSHCNDINKIKYILELLLLVFKQNNIVATIQIIDFIQNKMMQQLLQTYDRYNEVTTYTLPENTPINSILRTLNLPQSHNNPELQYVTNYNFVISHLGLEVEEGEIYQEKIQGVLNGKNILKICCKLQPYIIYPYELLMNYYNKLLKQTIQGKIDLQLFLENSSLLTNLIQNQSTYQIDFTNILIYNNINAFLQ